MPKRKSSRGAKVVSATVTVLTLSACTESPSSQGLGYIDGTGVVRTVVAEERELLGEVSGETLDGDRVAVADYAGQTVVLNFWWSQCPPCRAEAPGLADAATELRREEVVFLGVNIREPNPETARGFERTFDIPYPSLYDPDGNTLLAFDGVLSPYSIPSTVVVDEQGRIAATVLGAVNKTTLLGLVQDVRNGETPRTAPQ